MKIFKKFFPYSHLFLRQVILADYELIRAAFSRRQVFKLNANWTAPNLWISVIDSSYLYNLDFLNRYQKLFEGSFQAEFLRKRLIFGILLDDWISNVTSSPKKFSAKATHSYLLALENPVYIFPAFSISQKFKGIGNGPYDEHHRFLRQTWHQTQSRLVGKNRINQIMEDSCSK